MPLIALLQAVGARLAVFLIAFLAVLGVGSVTDSPAPALHEQKSPPTKSAVEEIVPAEAPTEEEAVPESTPGTQENESPEQEPAKDAPAVTPSAPALQPPKPEPEVQTEQKPAKSLNEINTDVSPTVVNILCSSANDSLNSISGSGVFIDSRGVILTNAHIAQYLLLKDYPTKDSIECVARTGSPAKPSYTLTLLYISPNWIAEHAHDITVETPTGTGEHDYALLIVTGRTDPSALLPASFPALKMAIDDSAIETGNEVLIRAYPAGFLGGISIQKELYAVATIASIRKLYTFNDGLLDLLSLGGSIAAQGGSSGGAVINTDGSLIGIVVTASREATTDERDLRAVTLSHINRDHIATEGISLSSYLSGPLLQRRAVFELTKAPTLSALLIQALEQ
ncbi:hypothetical protein COU17_00085 [Candidatus Kaiserbacteria bacterium CG10_big_fil_rev_8_21_14_0_10_49_17]|uniref:Serine protease n=1 Tax=Candidatus Kaiserbacteria bacterium CG10_big_fil_rev_8_21_14_0_10_49_17 TaxID=1974609 RepID=A0A2M6WFE7_9BACT|nr:MAG: hypothetical protein COU17_00085 [Candidatus Kaiserbacteria bacterium CG10_big_fil_rev_8_21_14_0_10_49_17]